MSAEVAPLQVSEIALSVSEAAPLASEAVPQVSVAVLLAVEILAQWMGETAPWGAHLHTWPLIDRIKVKVDSETETYLNCDL